MSTKRVVLLSITCLLLGMFIGVGIKTWEELMQGDNTGQLPRKVITITVEPEQQDELLSQLQQFGKKWRYAIRIAPVSPKGDSFLIQMFREDMKIIVVNPFGPGTFEVSFYDTNPATRMPDLFYDQEALDLREFVNEIPGAKISVEK